MLKLMYITNNPQVAGIVQDAGVERIFVDMEFVGKAARQRGMDTVQNVHTIEDIKAVRKVVKPGGLLVRCNPIHEADDLGTNESSALGANPSAAPAPSTAAAEPNANTNAPASTLSVPAMGSKAEIDAIVEAGADIIMLPYFKTVQEAETFVKLVAGRARTVLLIETPEAAAAIDQILALPGVDEYYIGLNDLTLGLGGSFMFQPLADGVVDEITAKLRATGKPFGFGGIAGMDGGAVPGRDIVKEHYRLGSTTVILGRSFCDTMQIADIQQIKEIFATGVASIRSVEQECERQLADGNMQYFADNHEAVVKAVGEVVRDTAAR